MIANEIIRKKRDRGTLSSEELRWFFSEYLAGNVRDYQVSALLMAIAIQGMTIDEVSFLTKLMRDSGRVLKWPYPRHVVVDKHSTGGVGDKTSLIILPLCVLEGLYLPMISGRGLGHSGGTLDKLESIPGMKVQLGTDQAERILAKHGGVFLGQTPELTPLDKKLYALRDVTGTVESVPLITASILSKKAAAGISILAMDVKFGSGAFLQSIEQARLLADSLRRVGEHCDLRVQGILSSMDAPLGQTAGNLLEIREAVDVLKGSGPEDTTALSVELALLLVKSSQPERKIEEIRATLYENLNSGRALQKFTEIVAAQGGDISVLESSGRMPVAKFIRPVASTQSGFISRIDVRELGLTVVSLGGGRQRVEDQIDPTVGLEHIKKLGVWIDAGEPLAVIHASDQEQASAAARRIAAAYEITAAPPPPFKLIAEHF